MCMKYDIRAGGLNAEMYVIPPHCRQHECWQQIYIGILFVREYSQITDSSRNLVHIYFKLQR